MVAEPGRRLLGDKFAVLDCGFAFKLFHVGWNDTANEYSGCQVGLDETGLSRCDVYDGSFGGLGSEGHDVFARRLVGIAEAARL